MSDPTPAWLAAFEAFGFSSAAKVRSHCRGDLGDEFKAVLGSMGGRVCVKASWALQLEVWAFHVCLDFWVLDPDQHHDADATVESIVRALTVAGYVRQLGVGKREGKSSESEWKCGGAHSGDRL